MRTLLVIFILLVFFAFDQQSHNLSPRIVDEYHYVEIEPSILSYRERIYLPVYADNYFPFKDNKVSLIASVHFENKSQFEPIYILSADYYNANGDLSYKLLDKAIRIEPLEANQIILNKNLLTKSPGLNIIVDWGTKSIDKKPRIYIKVSYITDSVTSSVIDEGIVISDQDEILDRRPL